MLDHLTLAVVDYQKSKDFYLRALAPLGITLLMEFGVYGGFGAGNKPFFWISAKAPDFFTSAHRAGASPIHVAFATSDRAVVDAFHREALAAGGVDHGAPGVRAIYHPHYYGAFVLDPDGNNVEAVCHAPA